MSVLAFPFSISNGHVETVEEASDKWKSQEVYAFIRTNKQERPLFPNYGTDDPTFDEFSAENFVGEFDEFYSGDIVLSEVEVVTEGNAVVQINVSFE